MIRGCLLVATVLVAAASPATAADWKMDAGASRLEFTAMFEKAALPGIFREFDARVHLDPDKPAEGRLDVTIVATSADMNSADVNKAIGGPEWFDFARFPRASFRATDIRRSAAGRYLAQGTLTLKGVQRPIAVPFVWDEAGGTARMEGEFVVKRGAFGIGTGEWAATNVIGPDVAIKFNVRLRKDD